MTVARRPGRVAGVPRSPLVLLFPGVAGAVWQGSWCLRESGDAVQAVVMAAAQGQVAAIWEAASHAWLIAKDCEGNLPIPVSLPVRMASSTLACTRWAASM